jgi:hypothetical protein
MSNRIDAHEIYKKLITDFSWLWEAPSLALPDDEYKAAFKLHKADWFPYMAYYKLDILNELKPYFFSLSAIAPVQGQMLLRTTWQFSKDTHASGIFSKHPFDQDAIVIYLDYLSLNNKEVIDLYKKFEKFEYKKEETKWGFAPVK